MKQNIVKQCDSYKICHFGMYPTGTQTVYSYFESRKGAQFDSTVFFGLQYLMKEYLEGRVVDNEKVLEGRQLATMHLGNEEYFNREMWEHIVRAHGGRLPIRIKAVPEGTPVGVGNVMMTIENTDEKCFALTNHLETMLCHTWYPSTVATLSREVKKLLKEYLDKTADSDAILPFQLHDFGFRGTETTESAAIGGAAHLVNFLGTDTVVAMDMARQYYSAPLEGLAYSVPATEHSIMTSLGREGEEKLLNQLLTNYPTGILSLVIDSYNYKEFISTVAAKFKKKILARKGKVVFRPDSGDPIGVTMDVLNRLEAVFGMDLNKRGYKVLNPKVGTLWGDGIEKEGIRSILYDMYNHTWSTENIIFGMGGGLLQKVNRDTQRFAFKSSAQKRDGIWYDIFKDPIEGNKSSKKGKLYLTCMDGKWSTMQNVNGEGDAMDKLVTVFENGEVTKEYTFAEVRKNAEL